MHSLETITPLVGKLPVIDTVGSITLAEIVDTALASVAARMGREAATATLIKQLIGATAPAPLMSGGKKLTAFWMGPDQWMIEAPYATHHDLADQIITKARGKASVTEQSDGWCRFDLTGERLADVFALLCNVDYPTFTGGEAMRTQIEHLGCFLICRTPDHASVIGPRSAAGSLHHALLTAIKAAI